MAGENKIDLKKGSQLTLNSGLLKAKFDTKQHDNLYAWSNVRSEYAAEASYATANNIYINNGWGWGPGWGAGWFWNPWYSSWAFVPAAGYFYDPFGWGFFSPAAVIYAPRYSGRGRYGYYPVNRAVARPGIGAAGIAAQSHGVTTMRPAPTMRMSAPRMR
jgi:hypothetical protein